MIGCVIEFLPDPWQRQRKSKKNKISGARFSVAARKCARVEACPRRRWLWQPTWAAGCALSARCKLPLRMLACAPCVCPLNSLLRPPAPPPRAAQTAALAALLLASDHVGVFHRRLLCCLRVLDVLLVLPAPLRPLQQPPLPPRAQPPLACARRRL